MGLILHKMLTNKIPNYYDNVEPGIFKISNKYSKEIYEILQKLLKVDPNERPDASELFSEKIVQMALENLSYGNFYDESQSQDTKEIEELR